MKKFKKENKVVRAQAGASLGQGSTPEKVPQWLMDFFAPGAAITSAYNKSFAQSGPLGITDASGSDVAAAVTPTSAKTGSVSQPTEKVILAQPQATSTAPVNRTLASQSNKPVALSSKKAVSEPKKYIPRGMTNAMDQYRKATSALEMPPALTANAPAPNVPMAPSVDLSKLAGEIPKTKSGMKKFMDEYGKFIALGAMAGAGGKGGQIAAPIIAALPGLIEMMKKKKKPQFDEKPMSAPGVQVGMAHGGSMKKSSGGEPPKKSEGGAIRKFKGGSMKGNTMDSTLTPKYAKGGDMPKGMSKGKMGKAAGEMPQHKKMAMGKPTPQSMGQKFAKGGAAKYASGGMCKGYGIAKKIRPTGPMN